MIPERVYTIKSATFKKNKKKEYKNSFGLFLYQDINCFNYGSLFSCKLNALITKNWRERIEGRDYFDQIFYISHNIKFDLEYLN